MLARASGREAVCRRKFLFYEISRSTYVSVPTSSRTLSFTTIDRQGGDALKNLEGDAYFGEPTFSCTKSVLKNVHVLAVSGEIDLAAEQSFELALTVVLDGTHEPLVIDLSDLTYIDSCGLSVLTRAKQRAIERGVRLYIVLSHPHIQKLFALVNFHKLFQMYETREDAVFAAKMEKP